MTTQESIRAAKELLSLSRSGDDDAHIWDQLPDESDKAYAAFTVYCELGPHVRSLEAAAKEIGKSAQMLSIWSSKYGWVVRARSWDSFERRNRYTIRMAQQIEMEERHSQIGQTLMRLGLEALSDIEPTTIAPHHALRFILEGVKVERLSSRLPTDIVDIAKGEPRDLSEDFTEDQLESLATLAGLYQPDYLGEDPVILDQPPNEE